MDGLADPPGFVPEIKKVKNLSVLNNLVTTRSVVKF